MLRVFILICALGQGDCNEHNATQVIILPERTIICPFQAFELLAQTELKDALAEGQYARVVCKPINRG